MLSDVRNQLKNGRLIQIAWAGTSFNAAERNGTHPIGQTQVAAILKILFKVESFMRPLGHNHLKDIVTNIM